GDSDTVPRGAGHGSPLWAFPESESLLVCHLSSVTAVLMGRTADVKPPCCELQSLYVFMCFVCVCVCVCVCVLGVACALQLSHFNLTHISLCALNKRVCVSLCVRAFVCVCSCVCVRVCVRVSV